MVNEKFGEFLVRVSNGKVLPEHILKALFKQASLEYGMKKLGEILIYDEVLTPDELDKYLEMFHKQKASLAE